MATFFNQATLSYSGGTVNSNITSGEILEVLSATKTAIIDSYSQGEQVTYAVNIINSGNTAFTGLTFTDNLGEYTFGTTTVVPLDYVTDSVKLFINGVLQSTPTVSATSPLTITGVSVPENSVATLIYTVNTNSYSSPTIDGSIENTVTISGGGITNITATETISASNTPNLTISKSLSPSVVSENGQLTYTFVITNSGNTAAVSTDNVVVSDTFDPILNNITVTYNGTVWTEGTEYTYDNTTGLFSTIAGAITVAEATFTQDTVTGAWITDPSSVTLTVTGTV